MTYRVANGWQRFGMAPFLSGSSFQSFERLLACRPVAFLRQNQYPQGARVRSFSVGAGLRLLLAILAVLFAVAPIAARSGRSSTSRPVCPLGPFGRFVRFSVGAFVATSGCRRLFVRLVLVFAILFFVFVLQKYSLVLNLIFQWKPPDLYHICCLDCTLKFDNIIRNRCALQYFVAIFPRWFIAFISYGGWNEVKPWTLFYYSLWIQTRDESSGTISFNVCRGNLRFESSHFFGEKWVLLGEMLLYWPRLCHVSFHN